MPDNTRRNIVKYHQSINDELRATHNRIRQLIGNKHWASDGEHNEIILRDVLRTHLPESLLVGRGFVCFPRSEDQRESSNQIDILIANHDQPTLYKNGDLLLVTPDSALALLEVKSTYKKDRFEDALNSLADDAEQIRSHVGCDCHTGLFVFDESNQRRHTPEDAKVLEMVLAATKGRAERVVNWIALGPDRFFRFWQDGRKADSIVDGAVWHSYILDNLAYAYFAANVVCDVSGNVGLAAQFAWFPIEDYGKEAHRVCYAELESGRIGTLPAPSQL